MTGGTLPVDDLLRVLMAEFDAAHRHNLRYLASLHTAANVSNDGLVTYEEFLAVLRFLDAGEYVLVLHELGTAVRWIAGQL